jgi:preprotein translocase subunit SecF
MQFIKSDINLNFIGKRQFAFFFSVALIVISIVSLVFHGGPKLGIDFEGGTLIQVRFSAPANVDDIKSGLQTVGLEASTVQDFSEESANEYLVRTETPRATTQGFSKDLQKALEASVGAEAEIRRVEMVGPQVGRDLREKALLAMFYALLGITFCWLCFMPCWASPSIYRGALNLSGWPAAVWVWRSSWRSTCFKSLVSAFPY